VTEADVREQLAQGRSGHITGER